VLAGIVGTDPGVIGDVVVLVVDPL